VRVLSTKTVHPALLCLAQLGWSKLRLRPSREELVMRSIAILSVLMLYLGVDATAHAQQTNDCKLCREYQQACLKNHRRDACNSEYNICMKYCGKK
jgi:hypothetical protein